MCTAFVYRGKDRICGFNMDLPDGPEWKLLMDRESFFVGFRPMIPEDLKDVPEGYLPCSGEYLRVQGVNRNGNFGGQLNDLSGNRAPFETGENVIPLYTLVDRFLAGKAGVDGVIAAARGKRVVNMPGSAAGLPEPAMHSLLSDDMGRILMIEPGSGYAEITGNSAVMSNFPVLIPPEDLTDEKSGYYGMDRYRTATRLIREAGESFSPEDGMAVLRAVKQEKYAPTRNSFVYSRNENAVYYALERDFDHIGTHRFS